MDKETQLVRLMFREKEEKGVEKVDNKMDLHVWSLVLTT